MYSWVGPIHRIPLDLFPRGPLGGDAAVTGQIDRDGWRDAVVKVSVDEQQGFGSGGVSGPPPVVREVGFSIGKIADCLDCGTELGSACGFLLGVTVFPRGCGAVLPCVGEPEPSRSIRSFVGSLDCSCRGLTMSPVDT